MSTDAQRLASKTFHAKRIAQGWRKTTFWMSPDTALELDQIAKFYGGMGAALSRAISYLTHPAPETEFLPGQISPAKLAITKHRMVPTIVNTPPPSYADYGKQADSYISIQLGPTPSKPGSRLKKAKP